MIAALHHNVIPLVPALIPEIDLEVGPSPRRAREQQGAGERQPRKPLEVIIDPYLKRPAAAMPAEPTQIYDHRSSAVLLGPPSLGQIVDIYA